MKAQYLTDIYRYDTKKDSWTKRRDYDLLNTFKFSGNEYCLTYKDGWYYVCSYFDDNDDKIYCLYKHPEKVDGFKVAPGEVVSEFRKNYLKNEITLDKIQQFLLEPTKFGKRT